MDKILTLKEVAKELNISVVTVRRLIERGLLFAYKYPGGRVWFVNQSDIIKFQKVARNG